jgi:two-component system, sensor histidine kinase
LSLSRKLARLLGGDVRLVESSPEKGSKFEATFKVNLQSAKIVEQTVSGEPAKPSSHQHARLLLVEDSPDNILLIKTYLRKSAIEISTATNGAEAVLIAKTQKFDVILMDIQMPIMDGYEATQRIRESDSQTPIIALTAHALAQHRAEAVTSGFTEFLTKPIRRDVLIETLQKHLNV